MIPREILKKIRQIEIHANRIVTESAARGFVRIPTGFRPKAQGCEERATLGHRRTNTPNRNAVAAIPISSAARGICHNPVGVDDNLIPFTQGSSCVATLGWRTQSLWDCSNALRLDLRPEPRTIYLRRCANRSSISAKTCSAGIPDRGFFRNSSSRRLSSASCSGVKSGSYASSSSWNSFQRLSKTCCLSLAGSGRISSIISGTVMAAIYAVSSRAQRFFPRANSSFVIRHSSFSPT